MIRKEINFDRFVRGLLTVLLIVGIIFLLQHLSVVLIPFFVAWMVAYLVYPIVRFLQTRCRIHSRLLAIFITLLLVTGTFTAFAYIIIPPMVDEFAHLKDVALAYISGGMTPATVPPVVQEFLHRHAEELQIENLLREKNVMEAIKNTLPQVWNMLWSTAGIVVNFVASLISLLYLFFLLTDYEHYANGWIHYVPRHRRRLATQLVADTERYMAGYFRGQALIALSNCFMFSIGFIIIGMPVPVGLGCLIGVISFVPYLQVVGFVPAALLALLKTAETGQNFWLLIGLIIVVYLVVQILQDTIFTPRIMGHIMGLRPAIILLSLSVWGYALGIIGLIIALPVTTLAFAYYKRYVVGENKAKDNEGTTNYDEAPLPEPISPATIKPSPEEEEEAIRLEKEADIFLSDPRKK